MSSPTPPQLGQSGPGNGQRPRLIDRSTLDRIRARAGRAFEPVLHDAALSDVQERLREVNKQFNRAVIVGPQAEYWANSLAAGGALGGATAAPDHEVLDLEPGAHDLVIGALCLHWAEDPVGQLVQMRRALAPDGLLLVTLFGGQTLSELRAVLAETEVAQTGGLSPRVLPMAEIRDLGALLQRAGLALPVADSLSLTLTYADLPALVHDLRAMGETNALAARTRSPGTRRFWAEAQARYAAAYPDPADPTRLRATVELITLTGWAPAASQPKPLRPGSATARLADALGTTEKPAGDTVAQRPRDHKDN